MFFITLKLQIKIINSEYKYRQWKNNISMQSIRFQLEKFMTLIFTLSRSSLDLDDYDCI